MDKDGLASTGWITVADARYYLDTTTGKCRLAGSQKRKWYYLGSSGAVKKGWISDNGTWYYTGNDGAMQTGWIEVSGKRYYLEILGKWLLAGRTRTANGITLAVPEIC